ncbi:hypothetical protein ABK040_002279 [Willaertia magna]
MFKLVFKPKLVLKEREMFFFKQNNKRADSDCGIIDVYSTLKPALIEAVRINHDFWFEHIELTRPLKESEIDNLTLEEYKKLTKITIETEISDALYKDLHQNRYENEYTKYSEEQLSEMYYNSIDCEAYGTYTMKPTGKIAKIHSCFINTGNKKTKSDEQEE